MLFECGGGCYVLGNNIQNESNIFELAITILLSILVKMASVGSVATSTFV